METIRRPFILILAIGLLMLSSAEPYFHKDPGENKGDLLSASVEEESVRCDIFLPFELIKLCMAYVPAKRLESRAPARLEISTVRFKSSAAPGHLLLQLALIPFSKAP